MVTRSSAAVPTPHVFDLTGAIAVIFFFFFCNKVGGREGGVVKEEEAGGGRGEKDS